MDTSIELDNFIRSDEVDSDFLSMSVPAGVRGDRIAAAMRLNLPPHLDAAYASSLHARFRRSLGEAGTLTVSGADVERVTTPSIQVLISGMRTVRADGAPAIDLVAPSAELRAALRGLGFDLDGESAGGDR